VDVIGDMVQALVDGGLVFWALVVLGVFIGPGWASFPG
jgi:hypothetical protein